MYAYQIILDKVLLLLLLILNMLIDNFLIVCTHTSDEEIYNGSK